MLAKLTSALVIWLLAAPAPADDAAKDKKALEGTWVVVSATRNGKPHDEIKDDKLVIEGDAITVKSKKREEKATFKIDPAKKPREMDLTPTDGTEIMKAIYSVEGDTVKMCFARPGGERPTAFESKEGSGLMLIELKREKK